MASFALGRAAVTILLAALLMGWTSSGAARGDQVASRDEDAEQGLFTRYLREALGGGADAGRYGNGDGKVTASEVKSYLDREMTIAARRQFGRTQNATAGGDLTRVLAKF